MEAHAADVAACMEALLSSEVVRMRLARLAGLPGLDEVQVQRLCALAGLHDLGKFCHSFQDGRRGHVAHGLSLLNRDFELHHELCEALRLPEILSWAEESMAGIDLLVAALAHHGRPGGIKEQPILAFWRPRDGRDPLAGIGALRERIEGWFPAAFAGPAAPFPDAPPFVHAVAGLVTLADWLGSDDRPEFFPFAGPGDPDRFMFARVRAQAVCREVGLDVAPCRPAVGAGAVPTWVWPFDPNAMQVAVRELPTPGQGSLVVLESETGSGKTEAAVARFLALFQAGLVDGLYFALPTRTAAVQLHARVEKAVKEALSPAPPVVLAVPGYLEMDERHGRRLAPFRVLWDDDPESPLRVRGWAAEHSKRYLAAAVAVGTVDQAMLATLGTKHVHLRSSALLRSLLVVDEVHASDAYMTRVLCELLQRHLGAGGHALLMSATLGSVARERYFGGRPGVVGVLEEACAKPYPAVSWRAGRGPVAVVAVPSPGNPREVGVALRPWAGEPADIAGRALTAAAAGAHVLVLRNTVRDCLAVQVELERLAAAKGRTDLLFACHGVVAPHHARFARLDRVALDEALESQFGKRRPVEGRVAVATQTVQQSLDIDADLLLTDLCPMDVLLQRVGRLHRHTRARPVGFEAPVVEVLVPAERDLGQSLRPSGEAKGEHGFGRVYDDLRILEATWRLLEQRPLLRIPTDSRELVEQTTHPAALRALCDELGGLWSKHSIKLTGVACAHGVQAKNNSVDWRQPYHDTRLPGLDEQISTRLGANDRLVRFAEPFTSPFGQVVDCLTVPGWMVREGEADTAELLPAEEGSPPCPRGWTVDDDVQDVAPHVSPVSAGMGRVPRRRGSPGDRLPFVPHEMRAAEKSLVLSQSVARLASGPPDATPRGGR